MALKHRLRAVRSSIGILGCALGACVMMPEGPTYTITGAVRDPTGGPESGVTVLLGGAAQSTTVTDGDGKYSFSGLARGTYTVTPTQGGYTCSPARVNVTLDGTSQVVPDFSARFAASIWAVGGSAGGSTVLRWDRHAWSVVARGRPGVLNGIWGTSANDAWAVGLEVVDPTYDGIVMHWNGSAWSSASAGSPGTSLYRGWSASPDDVWNIGVDGTGGFILRREAGSWVRVSSGWSPNDAWGSSANDIWAVGYEAIRHWDGVVWAAVPFTGGSDLRAIHGIATNDIWAVGSGGAAVHWNGSAWTRVETGTNSTLRGVWGSASDDVWAVGTCSLVPGTVRDCESQSSDAVIMHWDGHAWSRVASGTRAWLNAVWGRAPDDVWAVGTSGEILRWNGLSWNAIPSGVPSADLRGIWGADRAP
jgi:Carboxypeptidase regulatory-like domain